jgi:S-formylglutathione hydrolase FrmB
MKYLVIMQDPATGERSAFYTNWFDAANHYNPDYNMIVIDHTQHLITFDGETWQDIDEDHL